MNTLHRVREAESTSTGACPVCLSKKLYYAFSVAGGRIVQCHECDFYLLSPPPAGAPHRPDQGGLESEPELYLRLLQNYHGPTGRLLEVGCGNGTFLEAAAKLGYEVAGLEQESGLADEAQKRAPELKIHRGGYMAAALPAGTFDCCILSHVIEHTPDPRALLRKVRETLADSGTLMIATPHRASVKASIARSRTQDLRLSQRYFFERHSIESLLWQCGFEAVTCTGPDDGAANDMIVLARKSRSASPIPTISIVVPVFNERSTVAQVLQALESKDVPGMEKEIIVVESNSTDGTRDIVRQYEGRAGFKVIFEDRPRGKGFATRTGIAAATGDIVLIQDADMEYDFEDYEAVIEPIAAGREAFVLGARHGGRSWKMRTFTDQPIQAMILNLAHWGFTFLINVSLGLRLKDPFTMYKVFRRDCVHGLTFECNRFDFDWELLIKLVRKGYRPIEIPVNYRSRSFKEGKKVRMIRDPLTWIRAWAKSRFGPLYRPVGR